MAAFILNSVLLGIGLAMDAFTVSVADGLSASELSPGLRWAIPSTFALFQFAMPLMGWLCVRTIAETFLAFQMAVPWIALMLLGFIGGRMIVESLRDGEDGDVDVLSPAALAIQGLGTSIDALSAGFAIASYRAERALLACGIVAAVTWLMCACGLRLGGRLGTLSGRAGLFGGAILIAIGVEIVLKSL